ncbi:hypothetical protein Tsubulata_029417, partial [Turnera subulata]
MGDLSPFESIYSQVYQTLIYCSNLVRCKFGACWPNLLINETMKESEICMKLPLIVITPCTSMTSVKNINQIFWTVEDNATSPSSKKR